jgi:sulfate adenylyltransferase subunit 1
VFCINKLDAVSQPDVAFAHIRAALEAFAQQAGLQVTAILPISALHGYNVVSSHSGWCGYHGSSLLEVLSALPDAVAHDHVAPACPYAFSVQWVEKNASSSDTQTGRRTFWGLLCSGTLQVGNFVHIVPSGQKARIVRILSPVQGVFEPEQLATAGHSVGLVLDAELDVSRGDWLMAPDAEPPTRHMHATVAWMDTQPLVSGRMYWALHGHRWVKARVQAIEYCLNIHTLEQESAHQLGPNDLGVVRLELQEPIPLQAYGRSRLQGAMILVDTASHQTSGALWALQKGEALHAA